MNPTTQLKIEFFELLRLLNKSNLQTNQKTEILFFIENNTGKLTLCATTNQTYKIKLITKVGRHQWLPCGFSGLALFEEELTNLLNHKNLEKLPANKLTEIIKLFIFQQLNKP